MTWQTTKPVVYHLNSRPESRDPLARVAAYCGAPISRFNPENGITGDIDIADCLDCLAFVATRGAHCQQRYNAIVGAATPMLVHAFVRGPDGGPGRHGPPDETCAVCHCDSRNPIHEEAMSKPDAKQDPADPGIRWPHVQRAREQRENIKQAIKRLDAAHANLAIIAPRRAAAVAAWDQAQAHLASADADASRARDEITEARTALYALVNNAFEEP